MKLSILFVPLFIGFIQASVPNQDQGIDFGQNEEYLLRVSRSAFERFKNDFDKTYADEAEAERRFQQYMKRKQQIEQHNEMYERGEVTYKLGMNHFGDRSEDELNLMLSGLKYTEVSRDACTFLSPTFAHIRDAVDWRKAGAVTPVKNQGACGSCWAFSAVGALEGQYFRKTGNLVTLSEQNLLDCTEEYGNHGCDGGYMSGAYRYILENGGIDDAESYPYEGHSDDCRYKETPSRATLSGFCNIKSGDEELLKAAVATIGPVSAGMHVNHDFIFYKEGIYHKENCPSEFEALNHGVLVVGYGTHTNGTDFWLVKNSWGEMFGKKGYALMARNQKKQLWNCNHRQLPSRLGR